MFVALGGVVALVLFGVVVAHVLLMQGQFELAQLQQTSAKEQASYDRLRLEVSQLESPEVVVDVAQHRLGMVVPPRIRYLAPSSEALVATSPPVSAALDEEGEVAAAAVDYGGSAPASWSTVKPHLGDG